MKTRRNFIKTSALSIASMSFFPMNISSTLKRDKVASLDSIKHYHRYIAIDNVCAWPNLTLLEDGSIIATIFNKPFHGSGEGGDVECCVSINGHLWRKIGTAAQHVPGTNRMNVAAGLAKNGDLIVLASGWELKKNTLNGTIALTKILRPWVSRSVNAGKTWTVETLGFPKASKSLSEYIPFGDIAIGGDGSLRALAYAQSEDKVRNVLSMFRSEDDGKNWNMMSVISDGKGDTAFCGGHNETAFLYLGNGFWIAAARRWRNASLDLFQSSNDGILWKLVAPLTESNQAPGHLLKLSDGTLLLTYGNRIKEHFGVAVKRSTDNGYTWGLEHRIIDDIHPIDGGYPASVQLSDGRILTAYYAKSVECHQRYHMGVVIWGFNQ